MYNHLLPFSTARQIGYCSNNWETLSQVKTSFAAFNSPQKKVFGI